MDECLSSLLTEPIWPSLLCCRHEAMSDLVALLNGLVDENAHILIPGIYEQVIQLAPDEETLYETIDFDLVCFYL